MVLDRGDLVWVQLNPVEGSEQGGLRPALILSPRIINERSAILMVAPVTTRKLDRIYPFEVLVRAPDGGLELDSKVLLLHTRSIDRGRIKGRIGSLSGPVMDEVNAAINLVMGLEDI